MTAHSHRSLLPSLCSPEEVAMVGAPHQWVKVVIMMDAFWNDCEECKPVAVEAVAADNGAFLALWRVCILQETAQLRRPFGSAEADAEQERISQFDTVVLRKLTDAGARMWVQRARLFSDIGTTGAQERVLQRPETNPPQ